MSLRHVTYYLGVEMAKLFASEVDQDMVVYALNMYKRSVERAVKAASSKAVEEAHKANVRAIDALIAKVLA